VGSYNNYQIYLKKINYGSVNYMIIKRLKMLTYHKLENLLQPTSEAAILDTLANGPPSPIQLCKLFLQQSVIIQAVKKIPSLYRN
jgi:hypothetical protein